MDRARRSFVRLLGGAGLAALDGCRRRVAPGDDAGGAASSSTAAPSASAGSAATTSSARSPAPSTEAFPEKSRDLLLHTDRPPNLETRLHRLVDELTPNDAFFVRWHLQQLPTTVDVEAFRLGVGGHVAHPLSLSIEQLRKLPAVELVAVNQCSGNGRAAFGPRVPGVQWAQGAMGNARWKGVRLKDLLEKAGVRSGAVDVVFGGLDRSPVASVPDFEKSLSIDLARGSDVMVAYSMNGAELPMLNGFPLRLVVPGWYSTYWVKALDSIQVTSKPFDGYWMAKAYRVPKNDDATEQKGALAKETVPISRMNVRSFLVSPAADAELPPGTTIELGGVAFDGGSGIRRVEVSTDDGASYRDAVLGGDLGKYSWRRWKSMWTPPSAGVHTIRVRATSSSGETQPNESTRWNRSGYMRNAVERVSVRVAG
jgi:sulfite dehydrogenase (cytochrome) subunit A